MTDELPPPPRWLDKTTDVVGGLLGIALFAIPVLGAIVLFVVLIVVAVRWLL